MITKINLMLISALTSISAHIQLRSPTPNGDLEKVQEAAIT